MGYGNTNSPGAAATVERNGLMSAADKRDLETLKRLVPFTLMERSRSGNLVTFPDGLAGDVKNLRVTLTPTQAGSGDPSPTNVRPISGVSSVTVARTGKNALQNTASSKTADGITWTVNADGSVVANGALTSSQTSITIHRYSSAQLKPLEGMIFSGRPTPGYCWMRIMKPTSPWTVYTEVWGGNEAVIRNIPDNESDIVVSLGIAGTGTTVTNLVFKPMIRPASESDASFEPFRGSQSVTVSLVDGNNPLTVCGGTLDVTAGTLTVTHKVFDLNTADMDNSENYPGWAGQTGLLECVPQGYNSSIPNAVCNIASAVNANCGADRRQLWLTCDLKQSELIPLALDVRVVAPLIAPVTYQLTPQQLAALAGYNAVFANAGSVSVTYRADPTLAYEELTNAILSAGAGI